MFLKSIVLVFNFFILVNARGRMIDPPHRGNMWQHGFKVPANYDDMSLNCGGIDNLWKKNKGKCGLCGDPFEASIKEHEPGGLF